jgi:YqaJ-like viral recombinase domain
MTETWKGTRIGKFTASSIAKLMVPGIKKSGSYFSDGAMTYIESRAAEIFNQVQVSDLEGMYSIEWGNQHEPDAAAEFSERTGGDFEYYGKFEPKFFPYKPYGIWAGGSPDGTMPIKEATVEIKCPSTATNHIKNWRLKIGSDLKKLNPLYYGQIQFNMMCTGLHNGIFVSYDPRPQEKFVRMKILEVPYDKFYCEELHERIGEAIKILRQIVFTDILGKAPKTSIEIFE